MRELLIIDDQKIRREAFAEANKLLKKLDQLETSLESFHGKDQRLFNSWYELTFRDFRQRIDELRTEHEKLIQFHNWIAALVNMRDISPAEAIRILRQEEKDYASGGEKLRAKIDEIRRLRNEFIERDARAGFSENFFDDDDPFEEDNPRRRDSATEREFERIRAMSDEEIRDYCSDKDGAEELLAKTVFNAESFDELDLFLRIWDLTDRDIRDDFKDKFARRSGREFDDFLDGIRDDLEERKEFRRQAREEEARRSQQGPGNRKYRRQQAKAKPSAAAVLFEETKILYRKLVRRLHPDLQGGKEQNLWQKKVWDRVQKAYAAEDRRELDRLWKLILIRDRDLNALTVSEIHLGREALAAELAHLEEEARGLKKMPAWRFSFKKDHEALRRKLEKNFHTEYETIRAEIRKLRNEQIYYENDETPF